MGGRSHAARHGKQTTIYITLTNLFGFGSSDDCISCAFQPLEGLCVVSQQNPRRARPVAVPGGAAEEAQSGDQGQEGSQ